MLLSIVTTCKNRIAFLKQTIGGMCAQSHAEVIVVDYGCEQGTAAWLRSHHPEVRIVRVMDDPRFSLARARNIGARQAMGSWILFVDADTLLDADLGSWASHNARSGRFYVVKNRAIGEVQGTVLLSAHDFREIGGYDEAFRGWGGEDKDLSGPCCLPRSAPPGSRRSTPGRANSCSP